MKKLFSMIFVMLFAFSMFAKSWWVPTCDAKDHQHEYHEYAGFQLCYEETYEQPMFVSYHLTKANINAADLKRPGTSAFKADPAITTGSAERSDYTASDSSGAHYSRGHLAPNDDMNYSAQTQTECFLLSNMSPQEQNYFNGGIWLKAEDAVRDLGKYHDDTYVVTGPILDRTDFKTIGANKVAVPNDFYKIAVFCDDGKIVDAFAVIMSQTNKVQAKAAGLEFNDARFITSIDEIEKRTGLDFFPTLKDDVENALEAHEYGDKFTLDEEFDDGSSNTVTKPSEETPSVVIPGTTDETVVIPGEVEEGASDVVISGEINTDTPTVGNIGVEKPLDIIKDVAKLTNSVRNKKYIKNIARDMNTDINSVLYNIGLNGLEGKLKNYPITGTRFTYKQPGSVEKNDDVAIKAAVENNDATLEEIAEIYGVTVNDVIVYLGVLKVDVKYISK